MRRIRSGVLMTSRVVMSMSMMTREWLRQKWLHTAQSEHGQSSQYVGFEGF
jgi:hypothetical protein